MGMFSPHVYATVCVCNVYATVCVCNVYATVCVCNVYATNHEGSCSLESFAYSVFIS